MMSGGDPENVENDTPMNVTTKTTKTAKESIAITDAEIVGDPPAQQQEEVKPEADKKETVKETVSKETEAKPDGSLFPKEPQF